MDGQKYIDLLLKKYRQAPSFPFDDWAENPVSFYALMNLWDDVFRTSSGQLVLEFKATIDVKMDPESPIYDVSSSHLMRRIKIVPEKSGGTFHFLPAQRDANNRFRSELSFATDLDDNRLTAAFYIIRAYLSEPKIEKEDLARLDQQCVALYSGFFGFDDYDPFQSRRN